MAFVEFKNVKKAYNMGEVTIEALRGVDFEIEKGEICIVVGASGAGKTTILNILGGMDRLTEGSVILDGTDISKFKERQLTGYRRSDIGFVFQFYNLVQNLTALENVELAYAATVHKSQGSEFDAVILPILGGYDKLYFRNLLYTAVTRAKKLLVIVGSKKRLEFMVSNNIKMNRYTCLRQMLCEQAFGTQQENEDEQAD